MIKGTKHSKITKQKISEALKGIKRGKSHRFGKRLPIEHRRKISEAHKGKRCSEATKKKISESEKGKRLSEETKKKMRGRIPWNKGKKHSKQSIEKMIDRKRSEQARQKMRIARQKWVIPKKDTSIEVAIQNELKSRGYKFKKHTVVLKNNPITKPYQCDILFPKQKIVVECDGNYWHNFPHFRPIDILRTKELQKEGFIVLRFWGSEIKANVECCVNEIEDVVLGV